MILTNRQLEVQKFNDPFLKAIYFGLRTSDETVNEIISLCKTQGYKNLEFFKCKKIIFLLLSQNMKYNNCC